VNFHIWQWLLAALGAFLVGITKTGISGLSLLIVSIFANILPTKQASGVVLPLLIIGDVVAVSSYRRHTQTKHLLRLFPWAALGVVLGWLAMGRMSDRQARLVVGAIILGLLVLHLVRKMRRGGTDQQDSARWFAPFIGVMAGFTTLVANAAGPLMAIYLIAMRLPKMEFMGTSAVFFLLINLFKVPFMIRLGLINRDSAMLNLALAAVVLAGAWSGRKILSRIDQKWFENLALGLSAVAGIKMLF
jgi:uncharacterized membrane protein YfcA